MKNDLNIKINNYTNFYLKIERKYSDTQDEDDKWCNITIYISNNYINYNNSGELLLECEINTIIKYVKLFLENGITEKEEISFIEPDIEFILYNDLVELKINLFENGALSADYFVICLNKEEIKQILDYLE